MIFKSASLGAMMGVALVMLAIHPADAASRRDKARAPAAAPPPPWTVAPWSGPADSPNNPRNAPVLILADATPLQASAQPGVIRLGSLDGPSLGGGMVILLGGRGGGGMGRGAMGGDPLTCLTQAVYFEARSESLEGQEAVAQVVINRTHRAQFPSQVCGVVFQGAERVTGCQFSFVCDGALGPPAELDAWRRAGAVAQKALDGFVYKPMEDATHFHATYVTPHWSGGMTRIKQIGGHIFYR